MRFGFSSDPDLCYFVEIVVVPGRVSKLSDFEMKDGISQTSGVLHFAIMSLTFNLVCLIWLKTFMSILLQCSSDRTWGPLDQI